MTIFEGNAMIIIFCLLIFKIHNGSQNRLQTSWKAFY